MKITQRFLNEIGYLLLNIVFISGVFFISEAINSYAAKNLRYETYYIRSIVLPLVINLLFFFKKTKTLITTKGIVKRVRIVNVILSLSILFVSYYTHSFNLFILHFILTQRQGFSR